MGLNTTTLSNVISPVQVGLLSIWTKITTAGATYSLGIQTPGTLWAWGANASGQLGLNTSTNYSSPVQVGALSSWTQISAGFFTSTAVQSPGTLWAWGSNNFGQLGQSDTTNRSSPTQIGALTTWTQVSNGAYSMYAIQSSGTLWACGNNSYGQLGLGDLTHRYSLVQIGSSSNWTQIYASTNSFLFALAIQSNGTLWAWGNNSFGQLGLNNTTNYSSPIQVGALTTWTSASPGGYWSHGIYY